MSETSYRPVGQLTIFSKILERAVFLQFSEYLEKNNLIHPNHHGGRAGHNTATALVQMYDKWVEDVEEGNLVGAMLVDLSATFDMVEVPIMLEKLKLFGMEKEALM